MHFLDADNKTPLTHHLSCSIYPQGTTLYQTDDLYYAYNGNGSQTGIFNT